MIDRLGLIGDVHGEAERLELALATLRLRGVTSLVATGDVVDGRPSVNRCCELLEAYGVVTVRGNHDRWLLSGAARSLPDATPQSELSARSRAFLQQLPQTVALDVAGGRALLCHGLGGNDMAKVGPDDFGYAIESNDDLQELLRSSEYRWILNGHSHRRMVRTFGAVTIINAGTLKREHSPGFLEVDFRNAEVLVFEFNTEAALQPAVRRIPLTAPASELLLP